MPYFLKEDHLTHIGRYANLGGNSLDEIVHAILQNPLILFREMVIPFQKVISLFCYFYRWDFYLFSLRKH